MSEKEILYVDISPVPTDERIANYVLGSVVFAPVDCKGCPVLSEKGALEGRYIGSSRGYLQLRLFDQSHTILSELPRDHKDLALEEASQRAERATIGRCRYVGEIGLKCWRNKTTPRGSDAYESGRAFAYQANKVDDRIKKIEAEILSLRLSAKALGSEAVHSLPDQLFEETNLARHTDLEYQIDQLFEKRRKKQSKFYELVKKASTEFIKAPEYQN